MNKKLNTSWNKAFVLVTLMSALNSVNFEAVHKAFCNNLASLPLYCIITNSVAIVTQCMFT